MNRKLLATFLLLSAIVVFGFRINKGIVFKQNIEGYLKRAADANTIELAAGELNKVITYLEANDLTSGYTSVFYETPEDDIGFWYDNIKASHAELLKVKDGTTLEKTNTLLKLRETLLDHGGEGKEGVTSPDGLSVYPDNLLWGSLVIYGFLALMGGLLLFIPEEEWTKHKQAKPATDLPETK